MKLYLKPLLAAIRPGYKTVTEFVERRGEKLSLELDSKYSIEFAPYGEVVEISLSFKGQPATEPVHGGGLFIHIDPILLPVKGLEDLVTEAQTKASEEKKADPSLSYPREVWRILYERRIRQ